MKILSLYINSEKNLRDFNISFKNGNKILNTIILAGSNGSGKTTILESIYKYIEEHGIFSEELPIELKFEGREKSQLRKIMQKNEKITDLSLEEKLPKIIYMPSEIIYSDFNIKTSSIIKPYSLLNKIDGKLIEDIPSYIINRVIEVASNNENLTIKEVKKQVCKEVNDVFKLLHLNVKLVGISKDNKNLPIFSNYSGETFDIKQLSSGEKQLFLRVLAIKMLKPNNSIIMIDEPETSLHPKWQQKIVRVLEKVGHNNQIILATHSPHVLSSVPKENIILLTYGENNKVIYKTGEELYETYGQPVKRILEDIMGLDTEISPEVYLNLEDLRKLVREDKYDTAEYKKKFKKLEKSLGSDNEELFMINMDVQLRKNLKNDKSK